MAEKFCISCGNRMAESCMFCAVCGKNQSEGQVAQPTAQPAQPVPAPAPVPQPAPQPAPQQVQRPAQPQPYQQPASPTAPQPMSQAYQQPIQQYAYQQPVRKGGGAKIALIIIGSVIAVALIVLIVVLCMNGNGSNSGGGVSNNISASNGTNNGSTNNHSANNGNNSGTNNNGGNSYNITPYLTVNGSTPDEYIDDDGYRVDPVIVAASDGMTFFMLSFEYDYELINACAVIDTNILQSGYSLSGGGNDSEFFAFMVDDEEVYSYNYPQYFGNCYFKLLDNSNGKLTFELDMTLYDDYGGDYHIVGGGTVVLFEY